MKETQLLDGLGRNAPEAIASVYEQTLAFAWSLASPLGLPHEQVDEAVEDLVVKLVRQASEGTKPSLTAREEFVSYACLLMRNRLLDISRKRRRSGEPQLMSVQTTKHSDDVLPLDAFASMTEETRLRLLNEAIDALPEKERQVIRLYYIDELQADEIGAKLGLYASSVRRLLHRALRRVRSSLAEQLRAGGDDRG